MPKVTHQLPMHASQSWNQVPPPLTHQLPMHGTMPASHGSGPDLGASIVICELHFEIPVQTHTHTHMICPHPSTLSCLSKSP